MNSELPLTPHQIVERLYPHLQVAAAYVREIQPRIASLPAKEEGDNLFAAALTDADLAVQNLVEVALLGSFPKIRFYGEEYESSPNTKYFRATDLGATGDYLVTLDPIDGTRFYQDGHPNYQIILCVLNADDYEAVLVLMPAYDTFYYALRGQGVLRGHISAGLETGSAIAFAPGVSTVLLGWGLSRFAPALVEKYAVIDVAKDYSPAARIPNVNGILRGEIAGAILRAGKFIDGGALAFMARELGGIVTTWDGGSLPPLSACQDYSLPGLIIASSPEIHQHLLAAVQENP